LRAFVPDDTKRQAEATSARRTAIVEARCDGIYDVLRGPPLPAEAIGRRCPPNRGRDGQIEVVASMRTPKITISPTRPVARAAAAASPSLAA
jgi:hypothetical protein